jgi:hypothetical protein
VSYRKRQRLSTLADELMTGTFYSKLALSVSVQNAGYGTRQTVRQGSEMRSNGLNCAASGMYRIGRTDLTIASWHTLSLP